MGYFEDVGRVEAAGACGREVKVAQDRVLASCTVDELGSMQYEVRVWGQKPFDHERIYTIKAKDDNSAAQKCLELFVEEMEFLRDAAIEEK